MGGESRLVQSVEGGRVAVRARRLGATVGSKPVAKEEDE